MNAPTDSDPKLELFRHSLAALAYRAGKALRGAPDTFAEFRCGESSRTPGQILAHMGDLFDWALSIAKGKEEWRSAELLPWNEEVERFFAALNTFDDYLASGWPVAVPLEKLLQGPVADALTHTGQLTMLRRMAGVPMKSESYYRAEMAVGRVGMEQVAAKREF
jgi:hypothetical protein